jgi:DNA topoisomerase-2
MHQVKRKTVSIVLSYERLTHVEHILKRPDTYVGSLQPESSTYWTRVADHFEPTVCHVSPALVKIFDEVLVNAVDQYSLHGKRVHRIKVSVNERFEIEITNWGTSVPIQKHETEKDVKGKAIWIPNSYSDTCSQAQTIMITKSV